MGSGVAVILKDKKRRFLLQHRDNRRGVSSPGKWCFFGGGVGVGEEFLDAAVREMKEELNISMKKENLKLVRQFNLPFNKFRVYIYENPVSIKDLKLGEGQGVGFFTREEILVKEGIGSFTKWLVKLRKDL